MTALDAVETAFFARCDTDATMVALVGQDDAGAIRIAPGQWTETETAADYPRVAYLGFERPPNGGVTTVRLQADAFVWCEVPDPDADLSAIDARLVELFDRVSWSHGGWRFYARRLGGQSWPARSHRPIRRTREFLVLAHATS